MKTLIIILRFFIENLLNLNSGMLSHRLISLVKLSSIPAFFITMFDDVFDWFVLNKTFMVFVFSAIAIDHVLGTIVHAFYLKDFSKKKNIIGLLTKIGASIAGYVMLTMMHEIIRGVGFIDVYFKVLLQMMVFIYPAGSVMSNIFIVTGGNFPPVGWMNRLKKFQQNLDLNELKNKNNEKKDSISDNSDANNSL